MPPEKAFEDSGGRRFLESNVRAAAKSQSPLWWVFEWREKSNHAAWWVPAGNAGLLASLPL